MKRILTVSMVFLAVATFAFAGGGQDSSKPIKLVYGNIYAADHFYAKADLHLKEQLEKNSNGELLLDYFPASQLGSEQEMLQATRTGGQQICQTTPGMLATFYPKLATLELPYLFRDQDHYLKALAQMSSLVDEKELVTNTGLYVLIARARAPRQLTSKFAVNKLEDIKGIKIRVSEVPIRIALWKAFGTIPTPLPMGDVYTALATGTIDAQENPLDTIHSASLYEQQKYVALTAHMRELQTLMINKDVWEGLTAAHKKILQDAASKSAEMANKSVLDADREFYGVLQGLGMQFTTPDLAPFVNQAKTIWGQFGDKDVIARIEGIK
jgi:tripartite ATP-independent transporter DctP family solute receptor